MEVGINMKECLSFGAGVQSTTLLLLSCEGRLPKLDNVVFADTQWEPEAVYRHLEWCKDHAAKFGINIDVRTNGNLREDLIHSWSGNKIKGDGRTTTSIPAFIKNHDGSKGLVNRLCTAKYKVDVIERYVREEVLCLRKRQRWPLTPSVRQWIGISTDEARRMKRSVRPAQVMWHPLIESEEIELRDHKSMFHRGWSRNDCLEWLKSRGYPRPPRSACIGCPFRSNSEWRKLPPSEFADACDVDRRIRPDLDKRTSSPLRGDPYLHPSLKPLSEVNFGKDEDNELTWGDECSGVCGV